MKTLLACLLAGWAVAHAAAAELDWMTDLPKAQEKAKTEKKMVMLDFTGSDWCGWCKKLHKEVFSTDDFGKYAKTNLVLVEVDFPRNKQLTPAQKSANNALQAKYRVQGYPTIIVLNSAGAKVAELGYQPGGPQPFIAQLDKAKKK
jgi:protein disulfide-isomerase